MIESMQLEWSQKSIMDMFKIENLTDIAGKKVDLDFEEKDGKQKMSGISIVDERVPSFSDYERLENKLNQIINLLKK